MVLTKIGASLAGSAHTIIVTQGSHGFGNADRGKAVKMTDSSGTPTYALATANTVANADAIGIIIQVIDATKFIIALSGRITIDNAVPDLAAGTVLFLPLTSSLGVVMGGTDSGHLTTTEPSAAGHVSKPMAVITIANSEMIMLQQRGEVISSGAASIADDSIVEVKLNVSNAPTNGQVLTARDGVAGGFTWEAAGGPTEATQAVLEQDPPGSSTPNTYISPEVAQYHPGVAKAWCRILAVGTLQSPDYGILGVGDTGVGHRDINYTTAFSGTIGQMPMGQFYDEGDTVDITFYSATAIDIDMQIKVGTTLADRITAQVFHGQQTSS